MKIAGLIIVVLSGGLLLYATTDFPNWGSPTSPASTHISPYYIANSLRDTAVPNVVTAILADYRGFDTMFETVVIFSAGIVCFMLLRTAGRKKPEEALYRHTLSGITIRVRGGRTLPEESDDFERIDTLWAPQDMIVRTVCRLMLPFIQLFGLYVIAHGHHSPGGGFQGGVILGASLILYAISYDLRTALSRIGEKAVGLMAALGVFIYAGTGALCLALGANFLDYGILSIIFLTDPVMARSHGIFAVEVGVGFTVMATMISIYFSLASAGKYDEGL